MINLEILNSEIEDIFGAGSARYTAPYIIKAISENQWTELDDLFKYLWINFSGGDTCEYAANRINDRCNLGLEWKK